MIIPSGTAVGATATGVKAISGAEGAAGSQHPAGNASPAQAGNSSNPATKPDIQLYWWMSMKQLQLCTVYHLLQKPLVCDVNHQYGTTRRSRSPPLFDAFHDPPGRPNQGPLTPTSGLGRLSSCNLTSVWTGLCWGFTNMCDFRFRTPNPAVTCCKAKTTGFSTRVQGTYSFRTYDGLTARIFCQKMRVLHQAIPQRMSISMNTMTYPLIAVDNRRPGWVVPAKVEQSAGCTHPYEAIETAQHLHTYRYEQPRIFNKAYRSSG